jgi:probable phosphoglycerate mutase
MSNFLTIYFLRHGQTEANLRNVQQDHTDTLTELGLDQTVRVATALQGRGIERIISSPYERTRQTADVIAERLGLPIANNQLFTEVRRPSAITGFGRSHDLVKTVRGAMAENFHNPDWRHSDEENFHDQVTRAQAAVAALQQLDDECVLVVTHGLFLRVMLWTMCFQEKLTSHLYEEMYRFFALANTGIVQCTYDREKKQWQLTQWNEASHLTVEERAPHLVA